MKKLTYILMTAAALTAFNACSDNALDRVNEDVNHPKDADAKFIFTDVCLASGFTVTGGDFNTYLGVAVEHWGGCHNQFFKADQRTGEWISSSCFNNTWIGIYKAIGDARKVVEKTEKGSGTVDDGNATLNAAAKILLAYNSAILTDLFGDTPYSQACNYDQYKTPALDKQEDIYKTIMKLLDEAIEALSADGASPNLGTGANDLIYNGSSEKWLKFAHGLRARLTLETILKAADQDAAYTQILNDIDASFTSAADQAQIAQYDGDSQINPLFGLSYSREAIAASESLFNKLADRNDPRMYMLYCWNWSPVITDPLDPEEGFYPVPCGQGEEVQWEYAENTFFYSVDSPTHLLSYAELQFMKAEVLARKGSYTEARAALKNGLAEAFDNVNAMVQSAQKFQDAYGYGVYGPFYGGDYLTDSDVNNYVTTVFDPIADADLLAEIMVQKYLFFQNANGGSVQAYNDVRRLMAEGNGAENYIVLENPKNAEGLFPLRCGYGSSDTTTNPNVKAAFGDGKYVFTENVWWAGGTR